MEALVVAAFALSAIAHFAIGRIQNSTSTRYIGEFPEHLDRITAAIRTAAVRIDGMADCVDYGSFFRPEAFEKLRRAIQYAHETNCVTVRIVVCGNPQPISAASALSSPEDRLKDPEFPSRLENYLKILEQEKTGYKNFWNECLAADRESYEVVEKCLDSKNFDGGDGATAFDRLLLARHAWFVRRFRDLGARVSQHTAGSDVFLWLIDGVEAVFLFTYPKANALAFYTRDPALLRVLNSIFETKLANSKDYSAGVPIYAAPSVTASPAST
jgi:hypothetical protein